MIRKSKYYNQFTEDELRIGYNSMIRELEILPKVHPIRDLFASAWIDFQIKKFSYDGATFVRERNPLTIFEVAAFIHDWRNSKGYVGRKIDREFLCIMIVLGYDFKLIKKRKILMNLTFINVFRRMFLQLLYSKKNFYKKGLPKNIYKIQ